MLAAVDPSRALEAFSAWRRSRDLASLPPSELRMLPLVYRNLRAAGVDEAEIPPLLKEMYRSTWIRTRVLLAEVQRTVESLQSAGIDTLLLKGAALVLGYYRDPGARPMSDFDILVRREDVDAAVQLLGERGWRPLFPVNERSRRVMHAVGFKRGDATCDLHWWVLWESRDESANQSFWSESVAIDGGSLRTLRPEHQLLHVILHGTRRFEESQRWIADAMIVLRECTASFDWTFFVRAVEQHAAAFPVGEALEYLSDPLGAVIPAQVIRDLQKRRVSRWRRSLYAVRAQSSVDATAYFRAQLDVSLRDRAGGLFPRRVVAAARALQYGAQFSTIWPVVPMVARTIAGTMRRRIVRGLRRLTSRESG